jgi:hypothetical protein
VSGLMGVVWRPHVFQIAHGVSSLFQELHLSSVECSESAVAATDSIVAWRVSSATARASDVAGVISFS